MRVAHVIKATGIAGAERHLLMLLSGLRARDVDAQIVLLVEPRRPMDSLVEEAALRGIPVGRIAIRHHLDAALFGKLRTAFRDMQPDIVHTHLLHADLFGIPAARAARVPAIITSRHNDNAFRRRWPMRWLNRALWSQVDAGITSSDAVRRFCATVEGAPPKKLQTIYYGLERSPDDALRQTDRAALRAELAIPADAPVVGMVCRLVEQKGVAYGLEAFASAAADAPDARLVIAGDGALKSRLQAQARTLGVADRVHFLGWRTDALRVFAGLDIFLMPSLWEGFGLVLLEAMSQRLPIVASDVSAIPEVVADGTTGLLVPPRDVPRLAAALRLLLTDAPLRQHMGLLGEDRLEERFTAGRMVDETLTLYQAVLARRGRANQ
jgi:glycosyltransferase involved in cell wall biosynthesis